MRFEKWFVVVGFIYLIGGMVFGEWMGATQNEQYAPVHAHLNLAGGVLLIIFGILHRLYPGLHKSVLAMPQFLLSALSVPVFAYGIAVALHDPKSPGLAIGGSMAFLLGLILFFVMFLMKKDEA